MTLCGLISWAVAGRVGDVLDLGRIDRGLSGGGSTLMCFNEIHTLRLIGIITVSFVKEVGVGEA